MLRTLKNKKGQSLVEYALILGAIIVGILFMQLYVRRGVEGMLKSRADSIGEQYSSSAMMNITINRDSNITETRSAGGAVTTVFHKDDMTRTGNETLRRSNEEYWVFE